MGNCIDWRSELVSLGIGPSDVCSCVQIPQMLAQTCLLVLGQQMAQSVFILCHIIAEEMPGWLGEEKCTSVFMTPF